MDVPAATQMTRRAALIGVTGALMAGCEGGSSRIARHRDSGGSDKWHASVRLNSRAVVIEDPTGCTSCTQSAVTALTAAGVKSTVIRTHTVPLTVGTLHGAGVLVQPGGGEVDPAWVVMSPYRRLIRDFVSSGGAYLGLCLGAYLVADDPGYGLFAGTIDPYRGSPGANITTDRDALVTLNWAGQKRRMFFQDGPRFTRFGARTTVIATYENGAPAAVEQPCGQGKLVLCGPHPEATRDWYEDAGLDVPPSTSGMFADLVHRALR